MKPPPAAQVPVTSEEIIGYLMSYSPRTEPARSLWLGGLRDFTITHIGALPQPSLATAKARAGLFVKVTAFAVSEGCPYDIEQLWDPARVDRYLKLHPKMEGQRSSLVWLGRHLTRTAPWPALPVRDTTKCTSWVPYEPAEIERLFYLAGRQRNASLIRFFTSYLAVGYGAGLRTDEIPWVQVQDINFGPCGVTIEVGEPWPRRVPVLRSVEAVLDQLCQGMPGDAWLSGKLPKHYTTDYRSRPLEVPPGDGRPAPRVRAARLRATWVYEHLQRGVPFGDVMAATGHIDVRTLNDIVSRLTPCDPTRHHQLLRGPHHA
jgi:hypothetical protein